MAFFYTIVDNLYFNFYSFGTLLVTIFTVFLAIFYLTLKNKSESTFHLGLAFFYLSLFNFGYFYAACFYHPDAAYHRWFTGGFILPAILHFGQFFFYFPKNTHPKVAKIALYVQYAIALLVVTIFIFVTSKSGKKFHFTGHYWDFDAEPISKFLAIMIMLYSLVNFLVTGIWRAFTCEGKEKAAVLLMVLSMTVAALLPNYTNIASRDGLMERSTYLLSLVLSFVSGFFLISIVYINTTIDRTSFMVKIVGVSLVTIMLIMQVVSLYTMKDQDSDYDTTKIDQINRIIHSNEYFQEAEFAISYDLNTNQWKKIYYSDVLNLDLETIRLDLLNTAIYEKIAQLPNDNFANSLKLTLNQTHPEFAGYRNAILEFIESNANLESKELKEKLLQYISVLNTYGFVINNKLSTLGEKDFCKNTIKLLESQKKILPVSRIILTKIQDCKWDGKELTFAHRKEIGKFFRHFKPSLARHYRGSKHDAYSQRHFVSYTQYDLHRNIAYEIGFSYLGYRSHIHKVAENQQIILIIVILGILTLYPLFFKGALLSPLDLLLKGVEKVNNGSLVVQVPVVVQDEIGFLADSFNRMVVSIRTARRELQNYTDTLEEKVKERTREVEEKMHEVQKLKEQQDGDYYLTSLLAKPLFTNWNKSEITKTEFLIKQKKQFHFRNKIAEIGGDICISGNLRLGKKDNFKRYTFALNGDAMGKSMQGAGGALVMGVVVNSILARSARNDWVLDSTPEKWLADVYYEVNRIFKSFSGSMVISCVAMLISDETGTAYYFNAEHPFSVLYRDGEASFIENSLKLRKLGLDSEIPFEVQTLELKPGDIVILGSDGRDDIDLTPDEPFKTINEDENLFLQHVLNGKGDLSKIYESILAKGAITDDISLVRISYRESEARLSFQKDVMIEDKISELDKIFERGRELVKEGNLKEAFEFLRKVYYENSQHPRISKLFGAVAFRVKEYDTVIEVTKNYLLREPLYADFWFYQAVSLKKKGKYEEALNSSMQLFYMHPEHVKNLLNIANIKYLLGEKEEALIFTNKALELNPTDLIGLRLAEILKESQKVTERELLDVSESLG